MKTRQYCPFFPFHLAVGEEVIVANVKHFCLIECNVVGYTWDTKEPVIKDGDGVKVNGTELVKAEHFKTLPQPGLTPVANIYLGKYKRIDISELSGRTVAKTMIRDGSFIILCTDDSYVKMEVDIDHNDQATLRDKRFTIEDLRTFDLVNEVEWGFHQCLIQKTRRKRRKLEDEQKLQEVAQRLGKDRVEKILQDSA